MHRLAVIATLAVLAAVPALASESTTTPDRLQVPTAIIPNKATYDVFLEDGKGMFVNARGTFTDVSKASCAGWNVEQRLYVQFVPPPARNGAPTVPVYLRLGANTFESADGLKYTFEDMMSMRNQVLVSHKGEAVLSGVGQAGKATFTKPQATTVDIPAGTIFPFAYVRNLTTAAGRGTARYEAQVFDGSMALEYGVVKMQSFISNPMASRFKPQDQQGGNQRAGAPSLDRDFNATLSWPVRVNLMGKGADGQAKRIAQQGYTLMPNGRAEDMIMDFGQFSLKFVLTKIEELPKPTCR